MSGETSCAFCSGTCPGEGAAYLSAWWHVSAGLQAPSLSAITPCQVRHGDAIALATIVRHPGDEVKRRWSRIACGCSSA